MPRDADVDARNAILIDRALRYVRHISRAVEGVQGGETYFTIHFEGFGTGGTSGVRAEQAERYLKSFLLPREPHRRYGVLIEKLEVRAEVPEVTFAP